jgi:plastocyanin
LTIRAASVTVRIENVKYIQQVLTIAAGTTVEWENEDAMAHTVTADNGSFDSGRMNKGDHFRFTFTAPGTYPYYCIYHGGPGGVGQSGQIIVQ